MIIKTLATIFSKKILFLNFRSNIVACYSIKKMKKKAAKKVAKKKGGAKKKR